MSDAQKRLETCFEAYGVGLIDARVLAVALVHDGWARRRTITTETELAELPNTAVIRDRARDVAEKRGGLWCSYETSDMTDSQVAKFLPATVLDEGYAN